MFRRVSGRLLSSLIHSLRTCFSFNHNALILQYFLHEFILELIYRKFGPLGQNGIITLGIRYPSPRVHLRVWISRFRFTPCLPLFPNSRVPVDFSPTLPRHLSLLYLVLDFWGMVGSSNFLSCVVFWVLGLVGSSSRLLLDGPKEASVRLHRLEPSSLVSKWILSPRDCRLLATEYCSRNCTVLYNAYTCG